MYIYIMQSYNDIKNIKNKVLLKENIPDITKLKKNQFGGGFDLTFEGSVDKESYEQFKTVFIEKNFEKLLKILGDDGKFEEIIKFSNSNLKYNMVEKRKHNITQHAHELENYFNMMENEISTLDDFNEDLEIYCTNYLSYSNDVDFNAKDYLFKEYKDNIYFADTDDEHTEKMQKLEVLLSLLVMSDFITDYYIIFNDNPDQKFLEVFNEEFNIENQQNILKFTSFFFENEPVEWDDEKKKQFKMEIKLYQQFNIYLYDSEPDPNKFKPNISIENFKLRHPAYLHLFFMLELGSLCSLNISTQQIKLLNKIIKINTQIKRIYDVISEGDITDFTELSKDIKPSIFDVYGENYIFYFTFMLYNNPEDNFLNFAVEPTYIFINWLNTQIFIQNIMTFIIWYIDNNARLVFDDITKDFLVVKQSDSGLLHYKLEDYIEILNNYKTENDIKISDEQVEQHISIMESKYNKVKHIKTKISIDNPDDQFSLLNETFLLLYSVHDDQEQIFDNNDNMPFNFYNKKDYSTSEFIIKCIYILYAIFYKDNDNYLNHFKKVKNQQTSLPDDVCEQLFSRELLEYQEKMMMSCISYYELHKIIMTTE